MDIKRELPIPETERSARVLESKTNDPVIRLSIDARHLAAGGETSFVQLLLTWAGARKPACLQFRKSGAAEASAEHSKLTERFYGIVASLLSDRYLDGDGREMERGPVLSDALARLDQLYGPDPGSALKGPTWATLCADDINRSAPHVLYRGQRSGDAILRTREEFSSVVDSLVQHTFPSARNFLSREDVSAIAAMLYEIFRNTEDHALHNFDGSRIRKSVRGVFSQQHAMTPAKLSELAGVYKPLSEYCANLPVRHGAGSTRPLQQANLLEISTFDSGPGFAESFRKKRRSMMTAHEELDAVQECFLKNATSKGRPGFGQGLSRVLKLLREKKGFLRLRTGSLSLFIDLNNTDWDGNPSTSPQLRTWNLDGDALSAMRGSLLTFFIPLRAPE